MFKFFKKNDKYATISVYAVITCMTVVLLTLLLIKFDSISQFFNKYSGVFSPFIYAFIITFLCNPCVRFFENRVFRFNREKHPILFSAKRGFAITATILLLLIVLTLIIMMIVPAVISSYNDFSNKSNDYITSAQNWVDKLIQNSFLFNGKYKDLNDFLESLDVSENLKGMIGDLSTIFQTAASLIINYAGLFVTEIKNFLIGIFISIYFMASKEKLLAQAKKILYSLFNRRHYINIINFCRYTNQAFSDFIVGKVLDSTIIGLICFIVFGIFGMPYYPLLSVIIAVTNVIPVFGPFIGGIPCGLIILIAEPSKTFLFIIIILIIQQLDGTFIGPKILGDSVGISALWVLLSIVIFGGFFGLAGMILGVPLMAVIYTIVGELTKDRLRRKDRPAETSFYVTDPPRTDFETHSIFYSKEEELPDVTAASTEKTKQEENPKFTELVQKKFSAFLKKIFKKKKTK